MPCAYWKAEVAPAVCGPQIPSAAIPAVPSMPEPARNDCQFLI